MKLSGKLALATNKQHFTRLSSCEQNESLPENLQLKIRAGVHVGTCHSRVVYLQMPRMMICSTLVQVAAAAHAQCLRKFQYSDMVPL